MSTPSFSNIDKWLFELKEGNLSQYQIEELNAFLNAHPELQIDAETWSSAGISKDEVVFSNIHLLERKSKTIYFLVGGVSLFTLLVAFYFLQETTLLAKYANRTIDLTIEEQNIAEELIVQYESREQVAQLVQPTTKIFYVKATSVKTGSVFSGSKNKNYTSISEERLAQNSPTKSRRKQKRVHVFKNTQETYQSNNTGKHVSENLEYFLDEKPSKKLSNHLGEVLAALNGNGEREESVDVADRHIRKPTVSKASTSSFKKALRSSVRKVQKMMDNPIALKNFRDPNYHTPLASDFTFNPAMTGTQVTSKLQSTTRLNEVGTTRQQLSTRLAFDTYVYALRGGLGVDLKQTINNNGVVQNYELGFSYSPKFTVKKVISIEPGVRFKVGNKSINSNKLTPGLQIEEERGNVNTFLFGANEPAGSSLWYRDASLGLLINTPWFYLGGSVDNVGRHYDNIYSTNTSENFSADVYYNAQIGTDYVSQRKDFKLSTYILYQQRGSFNEAWLGANLTVSNFYLGAGVSSRFEPAVSLGFESERIRLIYQGDYTKSFVTLNNSFNHQLTLRFKFKPNRYAMRILNK